MGGPSLGAGFKAKPETVDTKVVRTELLDSHSQRSTQNRHQAELCKAFCSGGRRLQISWSSSPGTFEPKAPNAQHESICGYGLRHIHTNIEAGAKLGNNFKTDDFTLVDIAAIQHEVSSDKSQVPNYEVHGPLGF